MPERPTIRRLVHVLHPAARLALLLCALTLLSACSPTRSQALDTLLPTATVEPLRFPMTVEVTRIVMTERIVPATPTPPQPCRPETLAPDEAVTLAALLPLSRPESLSNALGAQTALTLAADAINAQGGIAGHPLRLWIGDAGSTPQEAAAAALHAITQECAVALVAALLPESGEGILAIAREQTIPLVVVEGAHDAVTAAADPTVFRLVPAASMMTAAHADWMEAIGDYNGDGKLSAALVVEDSPSALEHAESVGSALSRRGIGLDLYPVMLPHSDFSSLIARLVVREVIPDALFIRFNGESATALQRQLVENGIGPARKTLIVAMRSALMHESFWPAVGDAGAYTVVYRSGPWPGAVNEQGQAFATAYARYLNRWPDATSFAAYDAPFLLADAIVRADALEGARLIDALEQSDLTLAAGRYRFPFGAASPPESFDQPAWAWHQWMEPPILFLQYTAVDQPSHEMAVLWPPSYATTPDAVVRPGN